MCFLLAEISRYLFYPLFVGSVKFHFKNGHLDAFLFGDSFADCTMEFITILHHHLGE